MNKEQIDDTQYFIDSSGDLRKSIIIYKQSGSVMRPMAYISKPKFISDDEFKEFMDSLKIYVEKKQSNGK